MAKKPKTTKPPDKPVKLQPPPAKPVKLVQPEPKPELEPQPQPLDEGEIIPPIEFPEDSYGDGFRAAWRAEFEQN